MNTRLYLISLSLAASISFFGCNEAENIREYRKLLGEQWDFNCLQYDSTVDGKYYLERERLDLINILESSSLTAGNFDCRRTFDYFKITSSSHHSFMIQENENGEYQSIIFPYGSESGYMVVGTWDTIATEFKKWVEGLEQDRAGSGG